MHLNIPQKMKKLYLNPMAISAIATLLAYPVFAQNDITVNTSKSYQTITGIGSMALTKDEVDDLECTSMRFDMSPEYNKGLEMSGNDNNDPNVLDLSKFKHDEGIISKALYAKSKGVKVFIASVWSPPGWMKDMSARTPATLEWWSPCNNAANSTWCGGFLKLSMYEEYAEWLVGCIKTWKSETGMDLTAVSMQNEPEFPEPYGSCVYTSTEFKNLLMVVGKKFKKEGITTPIFYGEILWAQNGITDFFLPILKDPEALSYLRAFALHNYDTDGIKVGGPSTTQWKTTADLAARGKKELWMTETSGHSEDVSGMMTLAGQMYTAFSAGNISGWNYFYLEKDKKFVYNVHKQFTKFIRPGAVRIDGISSNADVLSLTFVHPVTKIMTLLLINKNSGAQTIAVKGSNIPQKFGVTMVNSSGSYAVKDSIAGTASLSLPANSVTVLNGKNLNLVLATEYASAVNNYQATVYPNPTEEMLTIEASESINGVVSITNLLGKEVMNLEIDMEKFGLSNINLSRLEKGMYILTISAVSYTHLRAHETKANIV